MSVKFNAAIELDVPIPDVHSHTWHFGTMKLNRARQSSRSMQALNSGERRRNELGKVRSWRGSARNIILKSDHAFPFVIAITAGFFCLW